MPDGGGLEPGESGSGVGKSHDGAVPHGAPILDGGTVSPPNGHGGLNGAPTRVEPQGAVTRSLTNPRAGALAEPEGQEEHTRGIIRLVVSALVLTVVLSTVMSMSIVPGQLEIRPGMPAPQDILSPAYLNFPSKILTEKARDKAMNDPANEVWVQDTAVVQRQRSLLINALAVVQSVRDDESFEPSGLKQQRLANIPGIQITPQQANLLLSLYDADYQHWQENGVIEGFDAAMKDRRLTSQSDVDATSQQLGSLLVPSLSSDLKAAAIAFIAPLLAVNMHLDEEQTKDRQQAAANNVKPVIQTVQKGEAVLRQGELATPEAIEKMEEAGLLSRVLPPQSIVGTIGIVALLMALLHLYIYRFSPQVWRRQRQILLVGLLLGFTVIVARLFLPGHPLLPYLLPVAAVSMLIAVLLNANLAVMVTVVMSVLLGMTLSTSLPLDVVLYYFVGGLIGILTLTRVERVSTFARAAFYIVAVSFLTALMLRVLSGGLVDANSIWMLWLAAGVNGFISASITYAAFSLLGSLFGITTPLHLMELAHPDQPLLRRLMHEAPGTYHHSLVVSNLAEHAAEMIGADSLLTRVSAYYHDIGKAERPYYFIDNQAGLANVHETLSPWESARIIAQHVQDGVKLGEKHNLPRKVLDAIPQHHGTMLIKYFYHKALQIDPGADPADFRYQGPKPQTKETAILMLADGVEATVRAMAQSGALDKMAAANNDASESPSLYTDASSLSDDAVTSVVHKTINERIEDGQLDECDLTVRDIARIQEAFVSMLKGIYHPRVVYPEKPKEPVAEPAVVVDMTRKQKAIARRQRAVGR
ncbi:MAG: HD family phosphohydrolase [Chloroflexia bacterium]